VNEKIKQLAKQSGIWFEDTKEIRTHSISTTTLEKFAVSIVQECLDSIVATKDRPTDNDLLFYQGLFTAIDGIKKRFGVEHEKD